VKTNAETHFFVKEKVSMCFVTENTPPIVTNKQYNQIPPKHS